MKNATLETLVWVLIYGGLGLLSISVFLYRASVALGTAFAIVGAVATALGAILIVVRSRRGPR